METEPLDRSYTTHYILVELGLFDIEYYRELEIWVTGHGRSFILASFESLVRFLSRVSILTRDIDIANLSVCLSVRLSARYVPVPDENGLTYRHTFFTIR